MLSRRLLHSIRAPISKLTKMPAYRFESLNDTSSLTEDQAAIFRTALDFANEYMVPFAGEWDTKSYNPVEVFKKAGPLGFASVYTGTEYGGCGLDRVCASLVMEALGTACVSTSSYMSILNLNCWVLDTFGSEELKKNYLPAMASIDLFSSYCLTEPGSGSDSAAMKTFAKKDGGDYVLNGSKCFITNGNSSDVYIVICKTGENERSAILVPRDSKGLSFGKPEDKMGWKASPTAAVIFDNVRVPLKNLISTEGNGFKIAMSALDGGRINIASTSLGSAGWCLAKTKEYVQTRKQFGKTIASFQNTQFKLAELATDLIASRLIVREAARKIDEGNPNRSMMCSMAKMFATDKCYDLTDVCLQLHGGSGYIHETGIERHLRDQRVNRILEGTNEIMRLIISRNVLKS